MTPCTQTARPKSPVDDRADGGTRLVIGGAVPRLAEERKGGVRLGIALVIPRPRRAGPRATLPPGASHPKLGRQFRRGQSDHAKVRVPGSTPSRRKRRHASPRYSLWRTIRATRRIPPTISPARTPGSCNRARRSSAKDPVVSCPGNPNPKAGQSRTGGVSHIASRTRWTATPWGRAHHPGETRPRHTRSEMTAVRTAKTRSVWPIARPPQIPASARGLSIRSGRTAPTRTRRESHRGDRRHARSSPYATPTVIPRWPRSSIRNRQLGADEKPSAPATPTRSEREPTRPIPGLLRPPPAPPPRVRPPPPRVPPLRVVP